MYNEISKRQTTAIKGLSAVGIVCYHLGLKVDLKGYSLLTRNWGYLLVGVFFFFTAFGTYSSAINDRENYWKKVVTKKYFKLLLPYFEIFCVYTVTYQILHNCSISACFISLINGKPIVENSWYVYAALYFSLILSLVVLMQKKIKQFFFFSLGITLYFGYVFYLNLSSFWVDSIGGLIFGFIIAQNKKAVFWLYSKIILFISIFYLAVEKIALQYLTVNFIENIFIRWIGCIALTIVFLNLSVYMSKSNILNFLGKISYELYLLHGLIMLFFRNDSWKIQSDIVYMILCLCVSIVGAYIWQMINRHLINLCKKII